MGFYCQPWLKAGAALAHLVTIHTRPDPLYNELQAGIKNSDEAAVRDTYIQVGKQTVDSSVGDPDPDHAGSTCC